MEKHVLPRGGAPLRRAAAGGHRVCGGAVDFAPDVSLEVRRPPLPSSPTHSLNTPPLHSSPPSLHHPHRHRCQLRVGATTFRLRLAEAEGGIRPQPLSSLPPFDPALPPLNPYNPRRREQKARRSRNRRGDAAAAELTCAAWRAAVGFAASGGGSGGG